MKHIHTNAAQLMSARNGTTTLMTVADGTYSNHVAFDVEGGEMATLDDGIARVVLSPAEFGLIADAKGAGHEVTADDGTVCRVSVWA